MQRKQVDRQINHSVGNKEDEQYPRAKRDKAGHCISDGNGIVAIRGNAVLF